MNAARAHCCQCRNSKQHNKCTRQHALAQTRDTRDARSPSFAAPRAHAQETSHNVGRPIPMHTTARMVRGWRYNPLQTRQHSNCVPLWLLITVGSQVGFHHGGQLKLRLIKIRPRCFRRADARSSQDLPQPFSLCTHVFVMSSPEVLRAVLGGSGHTKSTQQRAQPLIHLALPDKDKTHHIIMPRGAPGRTARTVALPWWLPARTHQAHARGT